MIEAVIWDFGGVLTSSPFEAFARLERERGLPADIIRRTNAANHLENAWAKFERAEVDIEAFDQLFATELQALGAEVRGKDVLPLLSGDFRPEMVEALKASSRNSRSAASPTICRPTPSAAPAAVRECGSHAAVRRRHRILQDRFAKPDPRIYQMMVETLDVDPENCVYLDDLGINLKPAARWA